MQETVMIDRRGSESALRSNQLVATMGGVCRRALMDG
jgi:hypothetical protein